MRIVRFLAAAAVLGAVATPCAAQTAGNVAKGAELFEDRCASCHAPTGGGQGPNLNGVYGRKAGSVAGFNFSPALKGSGLIWSRSTLDLFLSGPGKAVPGTAMLLTVPDAQQRGDVISYLATLSAGH